MNLHPGSHQLFLLLLGVIALAGIIAGCVLAIAGYSSAGPFAVASACVGVLGTLAVTERREAGAGEQPPEE